MQRVSYLCKNARSSRPFSQHQLSITEIADKCGFADSNTMGGTFKKIMGEAPGSYRKNH
ncbi:AraC family transcriptional regulator [Eubacterium sp. AF22-9]|uniref:helix-turn-helix domain-containing protein n=1 Tax=Eubacterium sp. AF22-9 TaxID=2292233 RepID=UPI00336BED8D